MSEHLLSVSEAAERLKVDSAIVDALIEARHLPAVRIGTRWRVPPPAIEEFYQRVCRGEVPADITPINGVIIPARQGGQLGGKVRSRPPQWTASDGN